MEEMTIKEKQEYLEGWGWKSEPHEAGFEVWTHDRFPGTKYKIDAAFRKMQETEKRVMTPVLTVQLDDPSAKERLQNFLWAAGITNPTEDELVERLLKGTSK